MLNESILRRFCQLLCPFMQFQRQLLSSAVAIFDPFTIAAFISLVILIAALISLVILIAAPSFMAELLTLLSFLLYLFVAVILVSFLTFLTLILQHHLPFRQLFEPF